MTAHVVRCGWPVAGSWEQLSAWHWVFWLAAVATLLELVGERIPGRAWGRWALRAGLVFAGLIALLQPYWRYTWEGVDAAKWLLGLTVLFVVLWASVDRATRRIGDVSWPFCATIVSLGTSLALILTGSQRLSELGLILTSVMGVLALAGLKPARRPLAGGASAVFPVIIGGLLLSAHFYSETPGRTVLLLAFAPSAIWIGHIPPLSRMRPWKLTAIRIGAVLALVLLAVVPLVLALRLSARRPLPPTSLCSFA
jgi:hypothetical protein